MAKKEKLKAFCHAKTEEEARAIMSKLGQRRWAGISEEERSKHNAWVSSQAGDSRRSRKTRCPCGAMTLKRARTRADIHGTGLGHEPGCSFYRALPRIAPKGHAAPRPVKTLAPRPWKVKSNTDSLNA